MNKFHDAKLLPFKKYHNPTPMVNRIPIMWYAKCHNRAIAHVPESPYLCTQIFKPTKTWQKTRN